MSRLVIVFLALIALTGGAQAETRKIRIGTEGTYRPFSYFDAEGKLTGFEVELDRAICAAVKADCEFVTMEFDGLIPALQEKKIDAVASGLRITEKRKKAIDFTDKYYTPYARFVSCAHRDQADLAPAAVKGWIIGTQSGSTNADYLQADYGGMAEIRLYKSMDDVYQDLIAGRLDAALSSSFVGYDFLRSENGKDCDFIGEKLTDPKVFGHGTGMGLRKGDDELRQLLNEGIKAVYGDGTFDAINARYWPFSVK